MSLKTRLVVDPDVVTMLASQNTDLMKLNQTALAAKMGISAAQVSRMMRGENTPTRDTVHKLAEALGVKLAQAEGILLKLRSDEAEA